MSPELPQRVELLELRADGVEARLRVIEATQSKQGALLMAVQADVIASRNSIEAKLEQLRALLEARA